MDERRAGLRSSLIFDPCVYLRIRNVRGSAGKDARDRRHEIPLRVVVRSPQRGDDDDAALALSEPDSGPGLCRLEERLQLRRVVVIDRVVRHHGRRNTLQVRKLPDLTAGGVKRDAAPRVAGEIEPLEIRYTDVPAEILVCRRTLLVERLELLQAVVDHRVERAHGSGALYRPRGVDLRPLDAAGVPESNEAARSILLGLLRRGIYRELRAGPDIEQGIIDAVLRRQDDGDMVGRQARREEGEFVIDSHHRGRILLLRSALSIGKYETGRLI